MFNNNYSYDEYYIELQQIEEEITYALKVYRRLIDLRKEKTKQFNQTQQELTKTWRII